MKDLVPQPNRNGWKILLLILAIAIILNFWYILLPLGLGIGYFVYRDSIHRFFYSKSIKRVQELVYQIHADYERYKELLIKKGENHKKSQRLRTRLLQELFELQTLLGKTNRYLDAYTSREVMDSLAIRSKLGTARQKEEEAPRPANPVFEEQVHISQVAPEILETYCNVQKDHLAILAKLEQMTDNREELLAIHESNMQRFNDIVTGYLKIKTSPKDFYHAEERLKLAKQALERFDRELDETLRRFNEADLQDFEVSLRMMKQEQGDPHDTI